MTGDCHVRFCERLGAKLPRPTDPELRVLRTSCDDLRAANRIMDIELCSHKGFYGRSPWPVRVTWRRGQANHPFRYHRNCAVSRGVELGAPGECPRCSRGASRRHGQYWRQLRAQPCMGRSVILYVQVWRFKCLNPQCPQTTFVEPIEDLAPAKHRRTVGFSAASCAMARRWADLLQLDCRQSWECPPVVTRCCVPCAARVAK